MKVTFDFAAIQPQCVLDTVAIGLVIKFLKKKMGSNLKTIFRRTKLVQNWHKYRYARSGVNVGTSF